DDRLLFTRTHIQPPPQQTTEAGVLYQPPNNVGHNQATVRINNPSGKPITINSLVLSSSAWSFVSRPADGTVLQPGQSADVVLKFIAGAAASHTDNQTIDVTAGKKAFGSTYTGTLTINSSDTAAPSRAVQLSG